MERQCHHCNAAVPEGAPFCPSCGAPQIRVVTPQATEPPPLPPPDDVLPPLPGAPRPADRIVWRTALKYCLISAIALTFLHTVIRIPVLTFLVIPFAGLLAAMLYGRVLPVNAWAGARLGAITGLMAFFANLLMSAAYFVLDRGGAMAEVRRALKEASARNSDPQVQAVMEKMMSPEGIAVLLTLGVILMLFMFLILCSVGGAIGGSLAKKKP